ncbi:unnamed protein product [Trichobilharzia regenti]|nr:unnamed protein product [Trichobilharzia regenti]
MLNNEDIHIEHFMKSLSNTINYVKSDIRSEATTTELQALPTRTYLERLVVPVLIHGLLQLSRERYFNLLWLPNGNQRDLNALMVSLLNSSSSDNVQHINNQAAKRTEEKNMNTGPGNTKCLQQLLHRIQTKRTETLKVNVDDISS